ncbi:MAG: OmpA family protein [Bacteroidota bacterium]|nr:OmpA family protein [Bacteroidota bacterium]MDP4190183.1 OmpA family protein [Bacteroidota bacterium]MDP4193782.1 OmpA family protein [Bacteroidota bacterium]
MAEWGDSLGSESQTVKYAPTKRTRKNYDSLETEDAFFNEENDKDRYLVTYADLITLLLGLFIILYAMSNIDLEKYHKVMFAMGNVLGVKESVIPGVSDKKVEIRNNINPINGLKSNLQNVISQNSLDNSIRLEENERGITIHILDDILFASANAEINESSKGILDRLASVIKTLPNDIRIEGHTDNVPIKASVYASNWHLSVARALNTAYYLINSQGLSPEKVSIVGYSEYRPVTTNKTSEGRRSNRRVDIVILKK